jgi:CspA family cold shock protein
MSIIGRILISLAIAAVATTAYAFFRTGAFDPLLFVAIGIATVASALLPSGPGAAAQQSVGQEKSARKPRSSQPQQTSVPDGPREEGEVKWFNVSKGFGFIVRGDGEEIFVHFRSIRGEGRRSLRDGQRVSFVVAESDKGPQAEDVEGL